MLSERRVSNSITTRETCIWDLDGPDWFASLGQYAVYESCCVVGVLCLGVVSTPLLSSQNKILTQPAV